jgi:integrase
MILERFGAQASEYPKTLWSAKSLIQTTNRAYNDTLYSGTKVFRHWKATMEYHKTKDILHVMRLLGHKNIKNTLIYTQLVTFEDDEYICKTAENVKEAKELIEAGYKYVCEMDSLKLFRKRK